jgi:photosystem II PsbU protein
MSASNFSTVWQALAEQLSGDAESLKQMEMMMDDPSLQQQAALVQEQMAALKDEQTANQPSLVEVNENSRAPPAPLYRSLAGLILALSAADAFQGPVSAFTTNTRGDMLMSNTRGGPLTMDSRREVMQQAFAGGAAVAAASSLASPAFAERDYAGIGYLGGQKDIDLNNVNIRVYAKLPGMYPKIAAKIVKNAPYKDKEDFKARTLAKLTEEQRAIVSKYEKNFFFLPPKLEYVIDNVNNGLYK